MPKKSAHAKDPFRIFPNVTKKDKEKLQKSIESVGLMNPVVIDEYGQIIDGHIRRDICDELGIDWLKNATVKIGLSDDQKKALAIELNLWRRSIHLTRTKRNELIDIYLIAHPELSESQVAELFSVSQPTINRRKRQLIQKNKLPKPTETIDKNGVKRKVPKRKTASLVVKNKKNSTS